MKSPLCLLMAHHIKQVEMDSAGIDDAGAPDSFFTKFQVSDPTQLHNETEQILGAVVS